MNKVTKVTVIIPTRSPLVNCENNRDVLDTGDRLDSLYSYNPQSVAARRISRTFGQLAARGRYRATSLAFRMFFIFVGCDGYDIPVDPHATQKRAAKKR